MSDDDRTVDADDAALDELRRLAADARNRHAPPPDGRDGDVGRDAGGNDDENDDENDDDVTVGADDSSLDELRRFAAEARAQQTARGSAGSTGSAVPADDRTVTAPVPPTTRPPTLPEIERPVVEVPERVAPRPSTTVLTDLPVPFDGTDDNDGDDGDDEDDAKDGDDGDDVTSSRARLDGQGWSPPPRLVMPTEPERRHEVHHGPWRTIAIGLAVALAVVTASFLLWVFVLDDGGSGEQTPTEPTAPPAVDGDPQPTDVGGGSGGD